MHVTPLSPFEVERPRERVEILEARIRTGLPALDGNFPPCFVKIERIDSRRHQCVSRVYAEHRRVRTVCVVKHLQLVMMRLALVPSRLIVWTPYLSVNPVSAIPMILRPSTQDEYAPLSQHRQTVSVKAQRIRCLRFWITSSRSSVLSTQTPRMYSNGPKTRNSGMPIDPLRQNRKNTGCACSNRSSFPNINSH